jgi:monofunctional biosynthetic peptidoglycan transglycosylase
MVQPARRRVLRPVGRFRNLGVRRRKAMSEARGAMHQPRRPRRGRWLLRLAVVLLGLPVALVVLYRFVPPPLTPLMLMRAAGGEPIDHAWVPLARISPSLVRAVIASEDERFCIHHGFDWESIALSWHAYRQGRRLRGASTISQQTAKNLFLWPGRNLLRKLLEAYATVPLELLWSKSRIIETYLNIVEWGHGIYGAEAASRAYFHKPAAMLTAREAALLAAVLPNPRRWSAGRPTPYVAERAARIERAMPAMLVPGMGQCR